MRIPLVLPFVIVGGLLACVRQPDPLLPVSTVVGAAVVVENMTEDPLCDQDEMSWLEYVDDLLNGPVIFFWTAVAFEGSLGWTLWDAAVGNPVQPKVRYDQITAWLPLRYSGLPPDQYDHVPVACRPPSPVPQLNPGCEPGGGRMSRPQADQLVVDVEQMGWRVTGLHEAGDSGKWSFDMIHNRSQIAVCIEDRLDYERKMAGLKLKDELQ